MFAVCSLTVRLVYLHLAPGPRYLLVLTLLPFFTAEVIHYLLTICRRLFMKAGITTSSQGGTKTVLYPLRSEAEITEVIEKQ